jgi:hypothetical protein
MKTQFDQAGNSFYSGVSALIGIVLINSYEFLGLSGLVVLGILMFVLSLSLAVRALIPLLSKQ